MSKQVTVENIVWRWPITRWRKASRELAKTGIVLEAKGFKGEIWLSVKRSFMD